MPIAISAFAMVAALVGAGPAAAEPSPKGCAKGDFCAWWKGADRPHIHRPDDFDQVMMAGRDDHIWVFNNGIEGGADHVSVRWNYTQDGGTRDHVKTLCLHFNPGPGVYKAAIGGAKGKNTRLLGVRWFDGEC